MRSLGLALVAGLAVVSMAHGAPVVLMNFNAPFTNPPISISPGFTVGYGPQSAVEFFPAGDIRTDNQWGVSPNFGNTGWNILNSHYLFEHSELVTFTIGGLLTDEYEVFARIFVNAGSFPSGGEAAYGSRLGLSAESLLTYSKFAGGTLLATGDTGGNGVGQYQIREVLVGTAFASGGQINVFLDDFDPSGIATSTLAGLRLVPSVEPLPGDADGDCAVGTVDYAIWAATFGQSGEGKAADFDGNGEVGAGDYSLWAANFGETCMPSASVPEPATGSLLLCGALSLIALGLRAHSPVGLRC